ncbi:unnamed protein product [Lactuca virosa]|uniref:Endonuclease/exonuclease/phosphatase domain-containing protein n=1 Tax=Lactuca virosa TaxID=75947 RepID=A0AAU9MV02_9ASTR|nr:unnamed protein product [Lactuca virosa]
MILKSGGLLLSRIPLVSSSFRTSKICMRKMSTKNTPTPTPTPVYPKFIPVEQNQITSVSKSEGLKFRVVSYNILAQVYVKSSVFPHSPSPCLKWKARSPIILDLLKHLDTDILCLQELDEYDTFYKEKIEQNDYSSIYIKRSGRKSDGCGIFYKHNKLELVIEETIDYNELANLLLDEASRVEQKEKDLDSKEKGDPNDPYVRLKRDCVGIMAAFKFKKTLSTLYHCGKHTSLLGSRMGRLIITGDFNSIPGDKVYQYLVSSGSVECLEDKPPINLSSVYACTRVTLSFRKLSQRM